MESIKVVTKKQFRRLVWTVIGVGLLINCVLSYFFITSGVTDAQRQWGSYMAISLLITGFGLGMAYSRMWLIKGFEKRLHN